MSTSQRRIDEWERAGVLEPFLEDYRNGVSYDELLGRYGKHLPAGWKRDTSIKHLSAIAKSCGVYRPSHMERALRWRRDARLEEVDNLSLEETEELHRAREHARLEAQATHAQRISRTLLREKALEDRLADIVESALEALEPAPFVPHKPPKHQAQGEHTAVAMLSDLHIGEVVSAEQTGGLGAFNMQIAARRLGLWSEKVLELVELRRARLNVPDLTILLGGDVVSGNIHDELMLTNEVNIVDATAKAAHMIAQAIYKLVPHFESIKIIGVVGNHGRMTKQRPAKERHVSWDYLCYQMIAQFLKEQPNVHFKLSKSFFELVNVRGYKILLMHGDSIKGSLGIPYYGIERASSRMRGLVDLIGERFDILVIGHFHDLMENSRFIINGSLKGSDEFSAGMLHVGDQPMQILFYVKPPYGIVGTERLYLAPADNKREYEMPAGLPSVWAEAELLR